MTPAASIDRLPELVRTAANQLFAAASSAEVLAAREAAGVVYDQAKRAARLAKSVRAHDDLVAAAHRAQADALEIESLAKRRLADEYDAAQERGEVAGQGKRPNISNGNVSTAADVGLSGKQIYEARQIRDAIREEPGIVRRALDELMASGDEPTRSALKRELGISRANLRAAVGTASASRQERGNNLYETPPEAMKTLLALEAFAGNVLEPACGKGAILRPLEDAGYEVVISDLVDYETHDRHGEMQRVADFLDVEAYPARPDIVTNPPYGEVLNAFVAHALRVHRPRKMALLLNLNFLCGFDNDDRNFAMNAGQNPPARIWVFSRRLPMMHRDGWDGPEASSRMNTAWFVWDDSFAGRTEIERVDWKDFQDRPALSPVDESRAKASEDNGSITGGAGAVTGEVSRPHGADHAGGTPPPIRRDSRRDGTDSNSPERPSVTQAELDEWRLLGVIDGGMTVSGPAVDGMIERGLVWRGASSGRSGLSLTVGGAERLAELEPRIRAASDGDAVNVSDSSQRTSSPAAADTPEPAPAKAKAGAAPPPAAPAGRDPVSRDAPPPAAAVPATARRKADGVRSDARPAAGGAS